MMSHCKNNFNDVLFPKHWKVLAFVISFFLTGAKTLESMGLLSSILLYKKGFLADHALHIFHSWGNSTIDPVIRFLSKLY